MTATLSEEQPLSPLLIPVASALLCILGLYGFLLLQGLPQQWTEALHTAAQSVPEEAVELHKHDSTEDRPPIFMVTPFVVLILCIASLPLIPAAARWWESNVNKFFVAASLGTLTLLYYALLCDFPVHPHFPGQKMVHSAGTGGYEVVKTVFINAVVCDFLPFIILLFVLFTIAGGIRITSNIRATPWVNSVILVIGSLLASFIGTTGAAVLLIRPLLDMNKGRTSVAHTVILFIFCVCNCGGCLTPLGDPPLFLGYLRGVEFFWTLYALSIPWLFVNGFLIFFYFLWDTLWFYRRESREYRQKKTEPTSFSLSGWKWNGLLLLGVVAAVALLDPGMTVPGTNWSPWYFLREAVQLGLAAMSLLFSKNAVRKANAFNFVPIGEVMALFFGIFLCLQPLLQILDKEGEKFVASSERLANIDKPQLFFWVSGSLSSVLDNAPTYIVFFETAKVLSPKTDEERQAWREKEGREFDPVPLKGGKAGFIDHFLLVAVALGSVFGGAMTYIGNGPNFMVKAIAERSGVKMPCFFGYMVYSGLILLPLFVLITLIFL